MNVRPAIKGDKPEWLRMRMALWPGYPDDHQHDIETFFGDEDDTIAVFVAERDGGGLCGFLEAGMRPYAEECESSPVGYIEGWWVDDDMRRRGVGAALVAAAEDWARSLGLTEMASDAELDNTPSHAAHEGIGYEEAIRIVCYRKTLAPAPEAE